jgi:energy-coupling factor transporter ATP-binding protein EcfA2
LPPALEIRDLWVALDRGNAEFEVLRGVDLTIERGERVALMGRNGAGKSTLLRTAAGLVHPVRGRIETPAGCALLTQNPGDYLVRERVGDELRSETGRAALHRVGLGDRLDTDPRDLSGGERQRLALAIVLAGRRDDGGPGLVGLDEPTRGMDRWHGEELVSMVDALADAGSAVIVATHDVELAARLADRIVLLGPGEVIADGPPREVLSGGWHFATETARILDGAGPIIPEEGAKQLLESHPGPVETEAAP